MVVRIFALAIALCTGATGVLPAGDGYRCVAMDRRMTGDQDCCPKCDAPPMTIGTPCCEAIHASVAQARGPVQSNGPRIAPAPLVAVLEFVAPGAIEGNTAARCLAAHPRGRPPGDQLERFSTILRI